MRSKKVGRFQRWKKKYFCARKILNQYFSVAKKLFFLFWFSLSSINSSRRLFSSSLALSLCGTFHAYSSTEKNRQKREWGEREQKKFECCSISVIFTRYVLHALNFQQGMLMGNFFISLRNNSNCLSSLMLFFLLSYVYLVRMKTNRYAELWEWKEKVKRERFSMREGRGKKILKKLSKAKKSV